MTASRSRWRTRGTLIGLVFLAIASLLLSSCSKPPKSDGVVALPPTPGWLTVADKAIQTDYTWAASHHAELQYIPCYCGCGTIDHDSNSACYFTRDKSGAITGYDRHAVG